ncbi:MAG: hypothetical protein R3C53_25555 [Pirellulaceae bacterium]
MQECASKAPRRKQKKSGTLVSMQIRGNPLLIQQATQWLSRTIAIVILMAVPGLIGVQIDRWLKTTMFTPAGFGLGIVVAVAALLVLSKKLTPPAGGKPIPFDDEEEVEVRPNKAKAIPQTARGREPD